MKSEIAIKDSLFLILLAITINGCGQATGSATSITGEKSTRIKVDRSPGSIEAADLNHDSFIDLAVTSETDSTVTILLGNGKGSFQKESIVFAGPLPNDVAIRDLNHDGNADLVIANHEHKFLTVLLGNGKGNFMAAPGSPFPVEAIPHTHGIATGDFNNDGSVDLVTDSWGNDQVEVLFGDADKLFKSQGKFFKVGKRPYQRLRAGDINKDGADDIVTTNTEGNNVTVLLSDGKGGFDQPAGSPFACGDAPFGLAIDDLDADGDADLAIINSPASMASGKGKNGLTILLGDGKGKFRIMNDLPFEAGKIPNRVAAGDLNGDGVNDVVVADNETDKIYLFLMNRNQTLLSRSAVTVGNHPKGIAIADFNGDGKKDIAVCNQLDNDISIIVSK